MIILFTGDGKGKTSAAIGTAIRAIGAGKKVVIVQFMKGRSSGEKKFFERQGYEFYNFGKNHLVDFKNITDEDKKLSKEAFKLATEKLREKPFLLVLDEINVAVHGGLVKLEEVLEFIRKTPPETNLVFTGRYAPKEMIEIANLVTEMKEIKHPFQKGEQAVEGIDY